MILELGVHIFIEKEFSTVNDKPRAEFCGEFSHFGAKYPGMGLENYEKCMNLSLKLS